MTNSQKWFFAGRWMTHGEVLKRREALKSKAVEEVKEEPEEVSAPEAAEETVEATTAPTDVPVEMGATADAEAEVPVPEATGEETKDDQSEDVIADDSVPEQAAEEAPVPSAPEADADYNSMNFLKLKSVAAEKGMEVNPKTTKEEILQFLNAK